MPRKLGSQALADVRSLLVAREHEKSQDIRHALASIMELRRYLSQLVDEYGTEALQQPQLLVTGTLSSATLARANLAKWPLARYEAPAPNGSLADAIVDIASRKLPNGRVPRHVYNAAVLCVKAELHRVLEHLGRSVPIDNTQRTESTKLSRPFTVLERENFSKYGARVPLQIPDGPRTWKDVLKALGSTPDMKMLSRTVRQAVQSTAKRLEEMYCSYEYDFIIKPAPMHCAVVSDANRARRVYERAIQDSEKVDNLLPRYSFGPEFDDSILHESYEDYIPADDDMPNGLRPKDQYIVDAMMLSSGDEGDDTESDVSDDSSVDIGTLSGSDASDAATCSESNESTGGASLSDTHDTDSLSLQPPQKRNRH